MIYLIFAILFSASLALALRISETFSDNRYGILVGNYVTCLVVAFVLLPDKNIFAAGSRTAVLTGIVNGFLFTGNLVLMQKCIRENGAVLSSAFAKLGIVIPITASILFLGEIPTLFQLVGIVLVIVAIWVINSEGDRGCGRRRRMGSAGLLLVLFVVSGMADGMSKVTERIGERRFDALFLFYTFLTALVLTIILAFFEQQRTRRKIGKMDFLSGVAVGFPNYFSTSLLLASVSRLPAFIVYPSFSVGTILVVSFVSVLVLGDPISRRQIGGCGIILVALALLNL